MSVPRFLILGGYGNLGFHLAHLLLRHTDAELVLAGRSERRAWSSAVQLGASFSGDAFDTRVTGLGLDLADSAALKRACEGVDCVIVAAGTSQHSHALAHAALATDTDYFDLQNSSRKLDVLNALHEQIRRAGRCFITEAGSHPGLPGALARYAARRVERLHRAEISGLARLDWRHLRFSANTVSEFLDQLGHYQPRVWHQRGWRTPPWWRGYRGFDFGPELGLRPCVPLLLPELTELPKHFPHLRHLGYYMAGFNPLTDWAVLPLNALWQRLQPQQAAPAWLQQTLLWSLRHFTRPPYRSVFCLRAEGVRDDGQPRRLYLRLEHADAYVLSAAAGVACLLQYLDGSIRRPGLWLQAQAADPVRLLDDMQRMGVGRHEVVWDE